MRTSIASSRCCARSARASTLRPEGGSYANSTGGLISCGRGRGSSYDFAANAAAIKAGRGVAMSAGAAAAVPLTNGFPASALRAQFPALRRAGAFIFFDNAAGAQVPQGVLDAVNEHLLEHNVQRGGRYPQSIAVDESIARARVQVAALLNARRPEEVAFGMNATSFIRLVSLAIGQSLGSRNEFI